MTHVHKQDLNAPSQREGSPNISECSAPQGPTPPVAGLRRPGSIGREGDYYEAFLGRVAQIT